MKNKAAVELGKLGGQATIKKYSKEQLKEWAKKGGWKKGRKRKIQAAGNI